MNINNINWYSLSNYYNNQLRLQKTMEKLSSGLRINRASDDSAGLSISESMRSQVRSLNSGVDNTQNGLSLISVADGSLNSVTDNLQRMRELAVQASNGTYTSSDLKILDNEFKEITKDIKDIADTSTFNNINLLSSDQNINIQTGDNSSNNVSLKNVSPESLNIDALSIDSNDNAQNAISYIDNAISKTTTIRAEIGAQYNTFEHTMSNNQVTSINLQSSDSKIRDTNYSLEFMNFQSEQMLHQASLSMMQMFNQNKALSAYNKTNYQYEKFGFRDFSRSK